MDYPLSRFASSPWKGDPTYGPAKPVPWCVLDLTAAFCLALFLELNV